MISVDRALEHIFALVSPLEVEEVPLIQAAGRVLARDARATRDQPPFAASAMDGYAVISPETLQGAAFDVIGEAAAGRRHDGPVEPGQAVRIFTGAPMPEGADRVIIQEDVTREGDRITVTGEVGTSRHIRPAANDFSAGHEMEAPRLLGPRDVALLAAMNVARVPVRRKPVVALISTGDELVMPGENPGPDQIITSNSFGLFAQLQELGAHPRLLPIARDSPSALATVFDLARGSDLIVTIGGASVGDHDLVGQVAADLGMTQSFYKIAMRPGKPLMAGRLDGAAMVGLPGNPVSAMVCGHVFLAPMVRAMLGLGAARAPEITLPLAAPLPANGPREHYMRARIAEGAVRVFDRQDSALLSVLAEANALVIRPPRDGSRQAGEEVRVIRL